MRFLALFVSFTVCDALRAQSPGGARLRGETESTQTRKRITEAQSKIAAGQPTEAADELQRVLEESGNDLVLVKDNNFQPARRLVQLTLAALPAEALKTYRDRLEAPAKKLLDLGIANRDAKPLTELRERFFIARPTEKALDLLGELHFERGEFADAERYWRMLLPAADANDLVYPHPTGDVAGYRAKAILAAYAAGDKVRANAELAALTKEHPQAKGRLAGHDGPYAETLAKVVKAGDFKSPDVFTLPRFPAMRPAWKTPIPRDASDRSVPRPASITAAKTLAFHPVIVRGFAYLADAGRVFAFDLKDGTVRTVYDLRKEKEFAALDAAELALPNLNGASFTITVAEGKLFVRMGSTAMPGGDAAKPKSGSAILAFEVEKNGNLKKLWNLPPPAGATWEGSPVVIDGAVIAVFCRVDERGRLVHSVASYPENLLDKANWIAEIAENDANSGIARHRQELLKLAGNKVVFTTHTGLTVALECATGRTAWAFRNPPVTKPSNAIRDLIPPMFAAGKVFVAPTDGDRLYALDAESGRPVWESTPGIVQQILGVADGKVIVAMSAPQKGIRGYRVSDGSTQEPFGWQNHDDPFLATYGRGIASENGILWPTMEKLYRLNPADGSVRSIPKPGPHGNLAFGDGMLLVATPTELWAYEGIPYSPEPERPKHPTKLIVAPKPAAVFDPIAATAIRLPLKLEKTESVPLAPASPREEVLIGTHRIGFTNEHLLAAASCLTGETEWGLDSLGRSRIYSEGIASAPTFPAPWLAFGTGLWVQTSLGVRWFVEAKTGKILHREPSAETPWVAPPVALPSDRIVFSDGPGLLRCFDKDHRLIWRYEAGGEASLTGVPPQAHRFGDALLVAVHRNFGVEFQRLDPATGRAVWRKAAVVNAIQFDWNSASADGTRLFLPTQNGAAALDLATGRETWKAETSPWYQRRTVRGRHAVFVFDSQPMPVEPLNEVSHRVARRFFERPRIERTVGLAGTMVETSLKYRITLAAFDPVTGEPSGVQEIPCPPGATLEFGCDRLAVRSPGTVSWWASK